MMRYIVTEEELLAFQIGELVMADITVRPVPDWATHIEYQEIAPEGNPILRMVETIK